MSSTSELTEFVERSVDVTDDVKEWVSEYEKDTLLPFDNDKFLKVAAASDGLVCAALRNVGATVWVRYNPEMEEFERLVETTARKEAHNPVSPEWIHTVFDGVEPPVLATLELVSQTPFYNRENAKRGHKLWGRYPSETNVFSISNTTGAQVWYFKQVKEQPIEGGTDVYPVDVATFSNGDSIEATVENVPNDVQTYAESSFGLNILDTDYTDQS